MHWDDENHATTEHHEGQRRRLRLYLVRHGESEANRQGVYAGQLDSPLTKRGVIDAKSLGERSEFLILPTSRSRDPHLFDLVYSSDLIRAHDTCKLILQGLRARRVNSLDNAADEEHNEIISDRSLPSYNIRLDHRLRERSYGTLQGMPWSSERSDTDKIWRDTHEKDELPPIFESDDDIWVRVKEFLSEVVKDNLMARISECRQQTKSVEMIKPATSSNEISSKHILITSHAGVLRQILMRLVGADKLKRMGAVFDAKRKNRLSLPNSSLTILDLSVWCSQKQANSAIENETNLGEIGDDDALKGIEVDTVLFACTTHLNAGARIHDD
jgi:broad specificity phosphatase PhoE